MTVKTTGAEFKVFYSDPTIWGSSTAEDYVWHDDLLVIVDGVEHGDTSEFDLATVADEAKMELVTGVICTHDAKQGQRDFLTVFRQWRKKQDTDFILVKVPKAHREALVAALAQFNATLLK